jgi:O-antigen ligase
MAGKAMTVAGAARWVMLGALFAVPFLPLCLHPALYFPYVTGRGFAFRLLIETAFAAWLVLAAADPAYRPRGSWIGLLLVLFVGWLAVCNLASLNPHRAFWGGLERMEGWITLVHLLAFFVVAGAALGAEDLWRRWWLAFVAGSALVCGYGLLQLAGLAPISRDPTRIDALFGNPEFLAGYLLFALAATLWLALGSDGRPLRPAPRLGLLALAALQAVILLASGTRGAVVALAAGAAFGLAAWAATSGRGGRLAAAAMLGIGIAGASAVVAVRDSPLVAQNPVLARLTHMGAEALSARFSLWRMAWDGVQARPVLGWGQEGFVHVFNRFYDPAFAAQEPWFDRAHSIYLDVLVAAGLPGLGLFLALVLAGAYGLWRAPWPRPARIALLGGLVAYAVQGLVVFDSLMTYVPLVALLAMAHATRARPLPAASAPSLPPRLTAPLALLVLLVGGWALNAPTLLASGDLVRALSPSDGGPMRLGELKHAVDRRGFASQEVREKLVKAAAMVARTPGAQQSEGQAFIDYAIGEAEQELAAHPHEARLRFELARLYRDTGRLDDARREIEAALAEAPRNPALLREAGRAGVSPPAPAADGSRRPPGRSPRS